MKLIVVIPAFNEEQSIVSVVKGVPQEIKRIDTTEILVVDDGSLDRTAEFAKEAGANYVYKFRNNMGVVHAFQMGIDKALENGADIIVNIDADRQFNPSEIKNLVKPIVEGKADVVLGSRFIGRSYHQVPVKKRIGNLLISLLVSILSGKRIRDTQCGFRALTRDAAKRIKLTGLFTYTQEMILSLSFQRVKIVEVPISVKYYKNRSSRVVKNIPTYALKVIGIMISAIIQQFIFTLLGIGFITITIILVLSLIL
ncbi:MAG: Family 2 glycosyl transferase [Candidatus Thorarchaeota archaeon]|nr:MAG: Family 2 glycosyl transferase [Candidatus Thorarchaeota archaeon]